MPDAGTALLERERELQVFRDALAVARGGAGRVVMVQAPAGLGKTSLLRAAVDAAADDGFACLRARATELERDFAYGSVRQLLEPAVAKASPSERKRHFAGAAELAMPVFHHGAVLEHGPSEREFSILHGLYWLVDNLTAEGPLMLAVDDLHWSDAASLRFFNFLTPRIDGLSLTLVATVRSSESAAPELVRLGASPETTVIRPGPLSTGATAKVCSRRLDRDVAQEFAAACRSATGGNPFFLEALLNEISDQGLVPDAEAATRVRTIGPASVADAVLLRLSDRPAVAVALIRAVAILGDGTPLAQAARLAELGEEEAARAADLLANVGIEQGTESLEFVHPIVREAVYGSIGEQERAAMHARAAEMLTALGADEERIAVQILATQPQGDPGRVELLRRVAAEALSRGAPGAAVRWLERALAEPPPPDTEGDVLLELSFAKLRLGTPEAAVDQLRQASERIGDREQSVTAVRLLAGAFVWAGDADRAVELVGIAIDDLGEKDRELHYVLEADRAAYAQQGSLGTRAPVAARLERYAALAGETPGERLVLAAHWFERSRDSETERDAVAEIRRALAGGRLLKDSWADVNGTHYMLLIGLLATDALDLASDSLAEMLADAESRASIPAQAFVIVHRGWTSFYRGDLAAAEADARTTLDLLHSHEIPLGTHFALALLLRVMIERGELEEARRELAESGIGDEISPGLATNSLQEARGLLRIAQGDAQRGLVDIMAFGHNDELFGGANALASRWRSHAALARAALGDGAGARRMAAEDLERARRWGAESGVGIALRANALVAVEGSSSDGLQEAVQHLAASPARLEEARALTDLGASLRRWNRRAEAREPLERGLELAYSCGARPLVERARTELRAAGGRSSDPYGTGVEQLTASELRVAQLAAEGRSNPEIAQTLFVTRKTVETHLGSVYRKLAIGGRNELAGVLDDSQ